MNNIQASLLQICDTQVSHGIAIHNLSQQITALQITSVTQQKVADRNVNCEALKKQIQLTWSDNLRQRSKAFANFIKSKEKAELYENWLTESPDYLPLKFRPKTIAGNNTTIADLRMKEAKSAYKSEVQILRTYALTHENRVHEIDQQMKLAIEDIAEITENDKSALLEWWKKETSEKEDLDRQRWQKRAAFLTKKKQEAEENSVTMFVTKTWDE